MKAVPGSESMFRWKQKQVEPLSLQEEVIRLMGNTVQIGNKASVLSCWMKKNCEGEATNFLNHGLMCLQ